MSQLIETIKLDVLIQARSKLYVIGIAVSIFFGLGGRFFFSPEYAGNVLAIFYLTVIGVSTYFFGAALVLLEKSQGTLQALRTSPLTSTPYLASKAITLTSFALVESALVYLVGFFGVPLHPVPLILGVVLLGLIQTLVGLGQVASHDAVPSFLIPGAVLIGTLFQLPAFYVLEVGPPLLWYLIPTHGTLLLMLGAFEPLERWQWVYAVGTSLAAVSMAAWWAKSRFARYVALQEA